MKTVTVYGDMQSDRASDQYPMQTWCDDCVERDSQRRENARIVSQQAYNPVYGESCEECGNTAEDEAGEA